MVSGGRGSGAFGRGTRAGVAGPGGYIRHRRHAPAAPRASWGRAPERHHPFVIPQQLAGPLRDAARGDDSDGHDDLLRRFRRPRPSDPRSRVKSLASPPICGRAAPHGGPGADAASRPGQASQVPQERAATCAGLPAHPVNPCVDPPRDGRRHPDDDQWAAVTGPVDTVGLGSGRGCL